MSVIIVVNAQEYCLCLLRQPLLTCHMFSIASCLIRCFRTSHSGVLMLKTSLFLVEFSRVRSLSSFPAPPRSVLSIHSVTPTNPAHGDAFQRLPGNHSMLCVRRTCEEGLSVSHLPRLAFPSVWRCVKPCCIDYVNIVASVSIKSTHDAFASTSTQYRVMNANTLTRAYPPLTSPLFACHLAATSHLTAASKRIDIFKRLEAVALEGRNRSCCQCWSLH